MTSSPKLLVVDKSVFHTFYDCGEKFSELVKIYNIVLPYSLAIECVISKNESNKQPDKLCIILDKAIKDGANLGIQSAELLDIEKRNLYPINTIINEEYTQQLRLSTLDNSMALINQLATSYINLTKKKTDELLQRADGLFKTISKNNELIETFNKPKNKEERFNNWIYIIDKDRFMYNAVKAWFGEQISSHTNANWYTWQYTRLWYAYLLDWCHKKSLKDSSEKKDISNDFYDMEPVLYLLFADGLLTNDQELQIPLAKAAFLQKDVFEINTTLNDSRTAINVLDDIIEIIPNCYSNK